MDNGHSLQPPRCTPAAAMLHTCSRRRRHAPTTARRRCASRGPPAGPGTRPRVSVCPRGTPTSRFNKTSSSWSISLSANSSALGIATQQAARAPLLADLLLKRPTPTCASRSRRGHFHISSTAVHKVMLTQALPPGPAELPTTARRQDRPHAVASSARSTATARLLLSSRRPIRTQLRARLCR